MGIAGCLAAMLLLHTLFDLLNHKFCTTRNHHLPPYFSLTPATHKLHFSPHHHQLLLDPSLSREDQKATTIATFTRESISSITFGWHLDICSNTLRISLPCLQEFEHNYRYVCDIVLLVTRSGTLRRGQQLHGLIIKKGFQIIPLVSHYLINFYSKSQLPIDSQRVFDETHIKSSTTWSSIISSFAQNELPILALPYFKRMVDYGFQPDDHIFPSATKSAAILSNYNVGRSVHCLALKTRYDSDVFVASSVVDMYAECGKIEDARHVRRNAYEKCGYLEWDDKICVIHGNKINCKLRREMIFLIEILPVNIGIRVLGFLKGMSDCALSDA